MIVMKFGGTSVQDAKAIERAGAIVKGRLEQKPVVVVSAMAKVTDQLLAMARAAGAGDRKTASNSAGPCKSATTTLPENCWVRHFSPSFIPTWALILKLWKNCCAASPPWAN